MQEITQSYRRPETPSPEIWAPAERPNTHTTGSAASSNDAEDYQPEASGSQQVPTGSHQNAQTQLVAPVVTDPTHHLPDPNPVGLQLSRHEVEFMERLGPLLPTPRAAKRLANLYRLVRIGIPDSQLAEFAGSRSGGPYQAVQILLAIMVGSPAAAPRIFKDLMGASPDSDILAVLASTNAQDPARQAQRDRITAYLTAIAHHTYMQTSAREYQRWCPQLARHSFHTRTLTAKPSPIDESQSADVRNPQAFVHRLADGNASQMPTASSKPPQGDSEYDPDYIWPPHMIMARSQKVSETGDIAQGITAQPLYLLCDVSYSMRAFLTDLNEDLNRLCQAIKTGLATGSVSPLCVIAFSETAKVLMPIGSMDDSTLLEIPIGGGQANYGSAFTLLARTIEHDTARLREQGYQVSRSCAFFLTTGEPSDDDWNGTFIETVTRIREANLEPIIVPFGVGDAPEGLLKELSYPPESGKWFHVKNAIFGDARAEIAKIIKNISTSADL
jgi:uncharacterized protein YegL